MGKRNSVSIFLFLSLTFSLFTVLNAQSSFSKSVFGIGDAGLIQVKEEVISFVEARGRPSSTYSVPVRLHEFSSDGSSIRSMSINSTIDSFGWDFAPSYIRRGENHLFQAVGWPTTNPEYVKNGLFAINTVTGSHWAKRSANGRFRGLVSANRERVSCSRLFQPAGNPSPNLLGISSFNINNGNPFWERHYHVDASMTVNYFALAMEMTQDGEVYVLGEIHSEDTTLSLNFLLHLSSRGEALRSVGWPSDFRPSNFVLQDDQIFMAGDLPGQPEGFVCKLDQNLNWQWCKRIYVENFSYDDPKIYARTDGTLAIVCDSRIDPIPLLYAQLDRSGNLLNTFGFAATTAITTIAADDGLVAISPFSFDSDGNRLLQPYLFKTTPDGTLDNCPTFSACINMEDLRIELSNLSWTASPAPPLPDLDVVVEPWEAYTEDYCGMAPPPSPVFQLPDTSCQYSCLSADSLSNTLASKVEWHLLGPNVDTVLQQLDFEWCFDTPGLYVLAQTLWFLGCDYTYEKRICVLADDLQPPIDQDELLICATAITPVLSSNRNLRRALWMDGDTAIERRITEAGAYSLLASDGYCEVRDTVLVNHFLEVFPMPWALNVQDTVLCNEHLPVPLEINSPYEHSLYYSGELWPANKPLHLAAGLHEVTIDIAGCELLETIRIESLDCAAKLYLPNVFSPNRDGVNDLWKPQGQHFQGLSLRVFDRWGSLIWERRGSESFYWDGTSDGIDMPIGIYVVVFDYRNELLQVDSSVSQEVLLLR